MSTIEATIVSESPVSSKPKKLKKGKAAAPATIDSIPESELTLDLPSTPAPAKPAEAYPKQGRGNPNYMEYGSLKWAIGNLTNCVRGVKMGGGTARVGYVMRHAFAAFLKVKPNKVYGSYKPWQVHQFITSPLFTQLMLAELEAWKNGWDPMVGADTADMREKQYKAAKAYIAGDGFAQVAQSIETIMAMSATNSVQFKDEADNKRPMGLVGVLDVMMLINMTATRLAKLGIEAE